MAGRAVGRVSAVAASEKSWDALPRRPRRGFKFFGDEIFGLAFPYFPHPPTSPQFSLAPAHPIKPGNLTHGHVRPWAPDPNGQGMGRCFHPWVLPTGDPISQGSGLGTHLCPWVTYWATRLADMWTLCLKKGQQELAQYTKRPLLTQ